jgi:hypothetical protein
MLKHTSKKRSKNINKLAAFIVDAITQKESETRLIKERNAARDGFERLRGLKEYRTRAEKNSSKVRGKMALKAAMERWSKSP